MSEPGRSKSKTPSLARATVSAEGLNIMVALKKSGEAKGKTCTGGKK